MYTHTSARHYAAYRPPLHQVILRKCLAPEERFRQGLDIGCGTGYSAIALTDYCEQVTGLDPSPDMLQKAVPHSQVHYQQGQADDTGFAANTFDVLTFAGSLFYCKSLALVSEMTRISQADTPVLVYDFDVRLRNVLSPFGISLESDDPSYDHSVNFSGLEGPALQKSWSHMETYPLSLSVQQLGHLLLASPVLWELFATKYESPAPYEALVAELKRQGANLFDLPVRLFYSRYQLTPKL